MIPDDEITIGFRYAVQAAQCNVVALLLSNEDAEAIIFGNDKDQELYNCLISSFRGESLEMLNLCLDYMSKCKYSLYTIGHFLYYSLATSKNPAFAGRLVEFLFAEKWRWPKGADKLHSMDIIYQKFSDRFIKGYQLYLGDRWCLKDDQLSNEDAEALCVKILNSHKDAAIEGLKSTGYQPA